MLRTPVKVLKGVYGRGGRMSVREWCARVCGCVRGVRMSAWEWVTM